jgi:hypothetical protein
MEEVTIRFSSSVRELGVVVSSKGKISIEGELKEVLSAWFKGKHNAVISDGSFYGRRTDDTSWLVQVGTALIATGEMGPGVDMTWDGPLMPSPDFAAGLLV